MSSLFEQRTFLEPTPRMTAIEDDNRIVTLSQHLCSSNPDISSTFHVVVVVVVVESYLLVYLESHVSHCA